MHARGLGVDWYPPEKKDPKRPYKRKKRRIAQSTEATMDLILLLSETAKTPNEILKKINYDPNAKKVMQAYIDHGLGDYELELRYRKKRNKSCNQKISTV